MQQISMLIGTRQKDVSANRRSKFCSLQGKEGKCNITNRAKQITFNRKNIEVFPYSWHFTCSYLIQQERKTPQSVYFTDYYQLDVRRRATKLLCCNGAARSDAVPDVSCFADDTVNPFGYTCRLLKTWICMVSSFSRLWINRVRFPILLVVS